MSEQTADQTATEMPFQYDGQPVISVNVSDFGRSVDCYRNVPTFGVTDMEAARAHLASHGVRMDDTFDVEGMVKLAGFHDPDGNPWMLAQTTQEFRGE